MIGDDAMFVALRPMMAELLMGFPRVAILVQTALGKLQATRRARSGDMAGSDQLAVFGDESEAIAFVTGRAK